MRYALAVVLVMACGGNSPAAPRAHMSVTVTATGDATNCHVVWSAVADAHGSVPWRLQMADHGRTQMLWADSGVFVDSVRQGAIFQGFQNILPWDLWWSFYPGDSLGRAGIHDPCVVQMCLPTEGSC